MAKEKDFTPPSFEEFKSYCTENGYASIAERVFKGYSDNDWRDSNNKPVLNWKLKLQFVWFKDSNKDKDGNQKSKVSKNLSAGQEALERLRLKRNG